MNTKHLRRNLGTAAGCVLAMIALTPAAHAQLTSQLGILDLTANGGINPGTDEAWKAGDKYHLIYVTTALTDATSTDIATYNAFVQADAASQTGTFASMGDVTWTALGSTVDVSAFANSPITGPVMSVSNSATVATGSADLWDFLWTGIGTNHIGQIDGTDKNIWTGTNPGGVASGGNELGATNGTTRRHWSGWTNWGPAFATQNNVDLREMVGISQELTVSGPDTSFLLTITPNAPESRFQLAWNSQPGMLYRVRSSTDLSGPISGWTLVEGGIAATPPGNTKNVDPTETMLFYAVEEYPAPPLFSTDFESGNGGFTVVAAGGTPWAYGDPESPNPGAWAVTTGNGGSANCWGTNLVGGYIAATDTSLRSPVIDLTGVTAATLSFARAIDAPVGADPLHTLEVNVIDATTSAKTTVIAPFEDPEVNASPWKTISVAIPAEALGKSVYLEWRFTGNGDDVYLGAYIDDVVVTAP